MAKRVKRTVKYAVTGAFGASPEGEIREAIRLLGDSDGDVLLYHPRCLGADGRIECASIEMAQDRGDGVFVSSSENDYCGWINISSQPDLDALVRNLSSLKYKES
jgi:hypothetical protein